MGRIFTLLLTAFALLSATANAYESGTPKDRAAVRWDAERLLARTVAEQKKAPTDLVISDIITDGDWALTVYRIGDYRGFMTLHKYWDQWWDMADGYLHSDYCGISRATLPIQLSQVVYTNGLSNRCLAAAGLPEALSAAAQKIQGLHVDGKHHLLDAHADFDCSPAPCGDLRPNGGILEDPDGRSGGGFVTILKYGKLADYSGAHVFHFYGRAPTENESTQHPNGDAFYFFTMELSGTKPVTFPEGTTIDVWFPHVLFPNLRYRITAGFGKSSFGPITGALKNNTLHFVLPQFTLAPFDSMMYEIDGDP